MSFWTLKYEGSIQPELDENMQPPVLTGKFKAK